MAMADGQKYAFMGGPIDHKAMLHPTSSTPHMPASPPSVPDVVAFLDGQELQPARKRITRACDACRKMKIKCNFPVGVPAASCQNCKAKRRKCRWESLGVKRERPPTKRDVDFLKSKIEILEKVMSILAPDIDISSLPRTAEQARTMAISNQSKQTNWPYNHLPSQLTPKAGTSLTPDYHQCYQDLAEMHLTPAEYLKKLRPDAPAAILKPWESVHESAEWESVRESGEPNLQDLMTSDHRSIAERCVERHHFRSAVNEQNYPPPDLANALVELYFQKVHPYECILHRGQFMQHYNNDLASQDGSFRALCYAVFAAASRFCSDSRIAQPNVVSSIINKQSMGALYGVASASFITPVTLPCTLFDLQAMAVLSYFLIGACSPTTAWISVGWYLRRAQDVGAHLADTPRFCTSILQDQLRKRAFYYLFGRELQLCLSLGRTSCIRKSSATVGHPLITDDAKLSRFCEDYTGKSPEIARMRFHHGQSRLASGPSWRANQACYALRSKFGAQLKMLWSVKPDPERMAWDWDRNIVKQMAQAIDKHVKYDVPAGARWNPDAVNEHDLILTARLRCLVSYFQIAVHRHLISSDPSELKVCLAASNMMLDVLDHLKTRDVLELTATYTPYFITPAALTFIYAACTGACGFSIAQRASAWADAHRCINVLAALAPTTFQAEKLKASLDHVVNACMKEQLFPGSTSFGNVLKRGILSISPAVTIGPPLSDDSTRQDYPDDEGILAPINAIVEPNPEVPINRPFALELFNVSSPELDAAFFQHPGKGFDDGQQPFAATQYQPSLFSTSEWREEF